MKLHYLSYRFTTIAKQLLELRYLILSIVIFGAVSSAVVGLLLALNIDRPVQSITQATFDLAIGTRADMLPEEGSWEFKVLQKAANFLVERLHELGLSCQQLLTNLLHVSPAWR